MKRVLTIVALIAGSVAPSVGEPSQQSRARRRNLAITGATGFAYALSETAFKYSFSPDHCRWCTPPSIDVGARNAFVWSDVHDARIASDIVGHIVVPVFAIGAVNLTLVGQDPGMGEVLDVTLPVLESAFASQLVTYAAKGAFGRERPDRNFDRPGSSGAEDRNVSFWSGHTALTFALAASAGTVASLRRSRSAPIIWGIGLTLATTTGYLRMAGDKHYLTDVAMGAGIGLGLGMLIPRLMHHELTVATDGRTVALAGTF